MGNMTDFKCLSANHNFGIDILSIQVGIALKWMPEDLVVGTVKSLI